MPAGLPPLSMGLLGGSGDGWEGALGTENISGLYFPAFVQRACLWTPGSSRCSVFVLRRLHAHRGRGLRCPRGRAHTQGVVPDLPSPAPLTLLSRPARPHFQ